MRQAGVSKSLTTSVAVVSVSLPHPVADSSGRGLELLGQLLWGAPSPHEFNHAVPKLS
jgi:hypothetical protein